MSAPPSRVIRSRIGGHLAWPNNRTHRKLLVVYGPQVGSALPISGARTRAMLRNGATCTFMSRGQWLRRCSDVDGQLDEGARLRARCCITRFTIRVWIPTAIWSPRCLADPRAGGSESMQLMYMMAITSARSSLHLSSSYFVPDRVNTFAKH